ncbi:ABC transporter substrate-binding protein [Massilia sp. S19_KUP03_FR1]|uniref:ABC transporter substrate-binding protein n=1 Tax=Massilia sp. S19_KUP03_FR1 TaxID=3025503 RepID=UPI002FCD7D08
MLKQRRMIIAVAGILLAALVLGWYATTSAPAPGAAPSGMTIAVPRQLSSGAVFVARDHGHFDARSIAVNVRSYTLGKQALQAVLDDQADLALVADVPFMLASQRGAPIAAIATVYASRQVMALVGRRDRGITALGDISGRHVGTVRGTNAEYFLDLMIGTGRMPSGPPAIVQLQPDQVASALSEGEVDAVTAGTPMLANILHEQGNNAVVMRLPDLYVYRSLLVGKRSFIEAHPEAVRSALQAMAAAVGDIQQQPGQAASLIAAAVGLRPQQLKASFRPEDFALSLDQTLLLSLDDQTRWAVRKGLIAAGTVPNYLDALDPRPLAAVAPAAVTIIH